MGDKMSAINNLLNFLTSQGVFEFYLPFLLVFSIFYALLRKIGIFGTDKPGPQVSAIVALVAAFYMMYATALGTNISGFLTDFFAQASIFLVLIMVIGIAIGALAITYLLGSDFKLDIIGKRAKLIVFIVVVLVVLALFASNLIQIPGISRIPIPLTGLSKETVGLIVLVGVTVVIIFLVVRQGKSKGQTTQQPQNGSEKEEKKS
jgi:hypothetical protein